MKKLFAFDVDGTLYDHVTGEVPKRALDAIKILKKQGHIVGIATGRNKRQLNKAISDTSLFDFIILVNGGYLEIHGEKVYDQQFSFQQKKRLCDLFDRLEYAYGITTDHHLYANNPMAKGVQYVIENFHVITPEQHDALYELPVYQFSVYEHADTIKDYAFLDKEYQIHSLGEYGYDMVIPGVNKATTLNKVSEHFKIDQKDTIVFGDSDNDQEMVKHAGLGIAMENGSDRTIKLAKRIAKAPHKDGIYQMIKDLGYINEDA
ncbi:MAG: Cof-type HAD-IIB family hydrolase [Candidatus Izimaplasma sp.]|nr:Cof-type HAD-IIB family hydrolase [Candidatus Izimaplasma bacterium]